jgi:predicted nucleic acid-binding protein
MVLVDSSVWIDYFNGRESAVTDKLDELLSSTIIVVGDLILAEVLQGFRRDTDYRTAKALLLDLEPRPLGGLDIAQKAASHFRSLRRRGVTVRKTVDCFIAAYCIEHRIPLLYSDRDFSPFVQHLRLQPALRPYR